MKELPNESIDLIITSPPYNAGINYDNYDDNQELETFLELLQNVWMECYRVLKIGGRLCINIGNIFRKPYVPLNAYTALACNKIGFISRGEIIWIKSNMQNKTSTQWGSWMKPSNPCLYDAHEYIQVYSKQEPNIQHTGETDLKKLEFLKWTKGEWYFNTINPFQKNGHPVPFPEELPKRLIKLYSWIGDVVLDPFCGCYDDQTEILTEDGFKLFKDLKDEKVASLDNGTLKYINPIAYQKYDYNGEMYEVKGRSVDLLITPNHKVYYKEYLQKEYKLDEIQNISYSRIHLTANCKWVGKYEEYFILPPIKHKKYSNYKDYSVKKILMNDWLNFLGWYLSDGHITHNTKNNIYNITITQTDKNDGINRQKIRECLDKLPFYYRMEGNMSFIIGNKQLHSYLKQFGKAKDKYIPKEILQLCSEQLEILFKSLMLGDGHITPNNKMSYSTISNKLRDNFQELLLKIEKSSTYSSKLENPTLYNGILIKPNFPCHRISIRKGDKLILESKKNISKLIYNGKVYCVTVPSHIIFVRRNGRSVWCGNSGTTPYIAKMLKRKYVGYDLSPKYCKISKTRCSQTFLM